MRRVGLLSDDPKVGSFAEQREAMGPLDTEFQPDERSLCLSPVGLRKGAGDVLVVAHARVLGRMRQRELVLADLAQRGVAIQLPGGDPVIYDTPEKRAEFHAEAIKPTGRPSHKQKRLMGRPAKFPMPEGDDLAQFKVWWAGPLHTDAVLELITERYGKKVWRETVYQWLGPRGKHPERQRKPAKKRKMK